MFLVNLMFCSRVNRSFYGRYVFLNEEKEEMITKSIEEHHDLLKEMRVIKDHPKD